MQCGDAEIVACIGADSNPPSGFPDLASRFSWAAIDAIHPYGAAGPSMPFAHLTNHYMGFSGATREDFARLSVASRRNAAAFDGALLGTPVTTDDYLGARAIAGPLHLLDLVMPCAGAEGFLVMRESRARALGLPFARVRATIERHNAFAEDSLIVRGGWALDAESLYAKAGLGPEDIDVAAMYDDYPAVVFMQIEALKFCRPGGAPEFVRQRSLCFDGDFPLNTNGGQLGCGQAGAAGGYLGLVEVLRQVTGQARGNAVEGARIGLVSGYGMAVYDRCLATAVAILEGEGQ
ncbi:lipid-transfer protein [compost metagenome]